MQQIFSLADGVLMSAKKDAFGNIGGFLAVQDDALAEEIRSLMVITEGFPTYGGLAGRELLPVMLFPEQSLCVALYEHIGIRGVEVGTVMLGKADKPASFELVRLAMPRRVYTQSHVDYMIEMMEYLFPHVKDLPGYKFDHEPKVLRHFSATFSACDSRSCFILLSRLCKVP